MQKFHQSRALAMLGALILYILVWPICCCAAKPTWSPLVTDATSTTTDTQPNYPNQTYQNLMTASRFSDNVTDKRTDFLNTQIGNSSGANLIDEGRTVRVETDAHNGGAAFSNTQASESMTTSIYELFDLRKGNRKFASSNQILSRADRSDRSVHLNSSNNSSRSVSGAKRVKNKKLSTLERNERSANLSHITGSARKIQLYIKNRFLQLLPDGSVNGTTDDLSDYTILQRTTVNVGQIKIQGVATCLFLCMSSCGITYGSAVFTDDCIFNEAMEQHHYNTYSSTFHSNAKRKLYLGLNRHGLPRKIQLPATRQLGKLATYTKSLTQTVAHERVEQLIARLYGANHVRHGLKQLCDTGKVLKEIAAKMKEKPKCTGLAKAKKKKRKRKCREDEPEGDHCIKVTGYSISSQQPSNNNKNSISNGNVKKKHNATNTNQPPKKCGANEDCKPAKKPPTNPNQPPKKCGASEDCKAAKKKNNLPKTTPNGNKPKNKKSRGTKATATTTPKPDDDLGTDGRDPDAFASEELEDEEEYDEMSASAGHSINLVEDHDVDEYSN